MKESVAGFRLTNIELLDFNLNYPENPLPEKRYYDFILNIKQNIDKENKLVKAIPSVDVVMIEDDKRTIQASIKVSCVFELQEIDPFLSEETEQVDLPNGLIVSINSVATSTVRGILFSELRGTFLHGINLPLVDPSQFNKRSQ